MHFADTLTGNDDDNVLVGGAGADSLDGGWGWRHGYGRATAGSAAAVAVDLGLGAGTGGDAEGDTFASLAIENLIGSAYGDTLTGDCYDNVLEGGAGADQLNGGDGFDTASYAGSATAVVVDLAAGTASGGDADRRHLELDRVPDRLQTSPTRSPAMPASTASKVLGALTR